MTAQSILDQIEIEETQRLQNKIQLLKMFYPVYYRQRQTDSNITFILTNPSGKKEVVSTLKMNCNATTNRDRQSKTNGFDWGEQTFHNSPVYNRTKLNGGKK
jgi:hypothetical protein